MEPPVHTWQQEGGCHSGECSHSGQAWYCQATASPHLWLCLTLPLCFVGTAVCNTGRCRQCEAAGYQPLAGTAAVELVVRSNSNSTDPNFTSTPQDQIYLVNEEAQKFCNGDAFLNATTPTAVTPAAHGGSWYTFTIPLAAFRCDYEGAMPADITIISSEAAKNAQDASCA